jgi:hypothetical protein
MPKKQRLIEGITQSKQLSGIADYWILKKELKIKRKEDLEKLISGSGLTPINQCRLYNLYNQYFKKRPNLNDFERDIQNLIQGIKKAYGE